ncbi:MAG: ACT domain-containing protein, partial [Clostridia bacterium]|nr:ACT domain-containing protein [Clostridia bacterium]
MLKQLSVFLQNKAGRIAQITRALSDAGVDLRALSIADTADFGILRMLVSDIEGAKSALAKENCIVCVNEVAVVAVPDEPGGLARILSLMAQENIDIEYMYSLIERS